MLEKWALTLACSLTLACAAARTEVQSVEELEPMRRAHEEVEQIKQNFRKALQEALTANGPAKSVDKCKIEAPKVGAVSKESIEVGRTSHKLRNRSNAPRGWVKPILEKWAKLKAAEVPKHELVNLGPNHWGYVEPIFVEALCLNCHGKNVAPLVKSAIKSGYPNDEATGFEVGQLRGLFWAEVKK